MSHYDNEREQHDLWANAPEGATHYGNGKYWRQGGFCWLEYRNGDFHLSTDKTPLLSCKDLAIRPQPTTKQPEEAQEALKPQSAYQRTIIGLDGSKCFVDIYRVLDAFKTDSPALDHAAKKILCPGTRHQKGREQDLREAIKSIEAELLLMSQR